MFVHFDSKSSIRIKIDVSEFAIAAILFQLIFVLNNSEQRKWHFVVFYSRKMILAETRYETHDQKLLTIIMTFKQWKHYLKSSRHFIIILIDHNNLRYFIITTSLNRRQVKWALTFVEYDFKIKYRIESINFANDSSKRFDYKNNMNDEICFLTLQNKLRNIIVVIINLRSILTRSVIKTFKSTFAENVETLQIEIQNTKKKIFEKNEKDLIDNVVIQQLRRNDAKTSCEEKKFLKSLSNLLATKIKKLQNKDSVIIRVKSQLKALKKRQSCVERDWHLKKKLLYFFHVIFVFEKVALKAKLLRLHHDDFLASHFEFKKTRVLM